jgi:hypothetical protein
LLRDSLPLRKSTNVGAATLRSREKDLANPSTNSRRKRGKGKNEPDQEGGEHYQIAYLFKCKFQGHSKTPLRNDGLWCEALMWKIVAERQSGKLSLIDGSPGKRSTPRDRLQTPNLDRLQLPF